MVLKLMYWTEWGMASMKQRGAYYSEDDLHFQIFPCSCLQFNVFDNPQNKDPEHLSTYQDMFSLNPPLTPGTKALTPIQTKQALINQGPGCNQDGITKGRTTGSYPSKP